MSAALEQATERLLRVLAEGGPPQTPIHRFDMVDSQTRHDVETYPSIAAMVEDWVQRWEDGSYQVDPRMGAVVRPPA